MHSSLKVPPQYFNQVGVWTFTGPLQHLDSSLFQTFCCRSAAVFGIIVLLMTQFQPSFICQTDGLIKYFDIQRSSRSTTMCPGLVTTKQDNIISCIHRIDMWYEAFVRICCDYFLPNMVVYIMTKHLDFCKIGNCLEYFPHVSNLSHCTMMDSTYIGL